MGRTLRHPLSALAVPALWTAALLFPSFSHAESPPRPPTTQLAELESRLQAAETRVRQLLDAPCRADPLLDLAERGLAEIDQQLQQTDEPRTVIFAELRRLEVRDIPGARHSYSQLFYLWQIAFEPTFLDDPRKEQILRAYTLDGAHLPLLARQLAMEFPVPSLDLQTEAGKQAFWALYRDWLSRNRARFRDRFQQAARNCHLPQLAIELAKHDAELRFSGVIYGSYAVAHEPEALKDAKEQLRRLQVERAGLLNIPRRPPARTTWNGE